MGKYVSFIIMLLLVGGVSSLHAQSDNPKDAYRQIYDLISKAEASESAGNREDATAKYQEIITQLKNFQQQYPDWETDIVRFRLNYAQTKLQALRSPNVETDYSSGNQQQPHPTYTYNQQPAPTTTPSPVVNNTQPRPNATFVYPPSNGSTPYTPPNPTTATPPPYQPRPYTSMSGYNTPPPSNDGSVPIVHMPTADAGMAPNYTNIPQPQPEVANVATSAPHATSGLQQLAGQVESELNRLMDENQQLRAAFSEAQSRVEVANNYMKVLTRENELLQQRLDEEVRRREELQRVLTDDIAQYNNHWNALRDKIRGLLAPPPPPSDNTPPSAGSPAPSSSPSVVAPVTSPSPSDAPSAAPNYGPQPTATH